MRAELATILLLTSCGTAPQDRSVDPHASTLSMAYGEMRDARVCAAVDPRTEMRSFWVEVERTEDLLFDGWQGGLGNKLSSAKTFWEETDAVSDKACPFQLDPAPAPLSLEFYIRANDALEAAIAAEAN